MTQKQKDHIAKNLDAYLNNFGTIIIENAGGPGFAIYTNNEQRETGHWIEYCPNVDYLNGWLSGAIKAANGIMKRID